MYNPKAVDHEWPGAYAAIDASASGLDPPAVPWLSKNFVAYFEAFLGAAPYYKTSDSRNKLDRLFTKALKGHDRLEDAVFDKYVMHKLRAWYTKFPPTTSADAGADAEDAGGGNGGGSGDETPTAGDSGPECSGGED